MMLVASWAVTFSQGHLSENLRLDKSGLSKAQPTELLTAGVNSYFSPDLTVGLGLARAWVSENASGEPTEVGISLSESSLDSLPSVETDYVFELPKERGKNFYTFVMLNWNPHGHDPIQIYGLPHFDVHFYIVPNEMRMAIGPDDMKQFANAPATKYVPEKYILVPGGVMAMGAHWADVTSPEFNGSKFTKTFLWGSYDGNFIFWEPMITREYLLSHPDENITLKQPSAYQRDGYYPTRYRVSYSPSEKSYTIAITDLEFHKGE